MSQSPSAAPPVLASAKTPTGNTPAKLSNTSSSTKAPLVGGSTVKAPEAATPGGGDENASKVADAQRDGVKEMFRAIYRGLETEDTPSPRHTPSVPPRDKDVAIDVKVFLPCILVFYTKFLTAQQLIELVYREVRSGPNPVGAIRFLCEWVRARYARDVRGQRKLLSVICKLAMRRASGKHPRPTELNEAIMHELNCLKLAIISCAPHVIQGRRRAPLTIPSHIAALALPGAGASSHIVTSTSAGISRRSTKADASPALPSAASEPNLSLSRPHAAPGSGTREVSSVKVFMAAPPRDIATHLLHMNYEAFSCVQLSEFHTKASNHSTLAAYIARCERIMMWVASSVLVQKDVDSQRKVAIKFFEVANFCLGNGDYASCCAIMQGFELGFVSRLLRRWKLPINLRELAKLSEALIKPDGNYLLYRQAIAKRIAMEKPCVLHLGMHQKDLEFIKQNPDYDATHNVNTAKILMIGKVLCEISVCQSLAPKNHADFAPNHSLHTVLSALPSRSEAELEALSEAHRPRANVDTTPEDSTDASSATPQGNASSQTASSSNDGESSSARSEDFADV